MKRFSLNKKRASKVLALTLLAALAVPSVSVQNTSAASTGSTRAATVPDPVMTVDFADTDSYIMSSSVTGKQLRLSNATESVVWGLMNKDGKLVTGSETPVVTKKAQMVTGKSYATGATVDMYRLDSYVWDDIDVAPTAEAVTISSGEAINVKTTALALKDSVENGGTYPGGLNDSTEIQWKKVYNSGVQVKNPFADAKYRGTDKLYDESRYSFSNVTKTATAVERIAAVDNDANRTLNTATKLGNKGSRYSGPESSKGITISFWAQTPVDPDEGALKDTNFFEFVNKKSLVYNPDQMAKAYVADQVDQVIKANDTATNTDSEGYRGTIATGKVVAVGNNNGRRVLGLVTSSTVEANTDVFVKINDKTVGKKDTYFPKATAAPIEVTFVKDMGSVACLIPANISWYNTEKAYYTENLSQAKPIASLEKDTKGTLLKPVWESTMTTGGVITGIDKGDSVGIRHMLIVATNEKDEKGNTKVYGLSTTTVMPTDSTKWAESDYAKGQYNGFTVDADSETGYGDNLQVKEGATGVLYADQTMTYYRRDHGQEDDLGSRSDGGGYTGTYINVTDEGNTGNVEGRNHADVTYKNNATAVAWHYYTVTITDSYFQMYQDGVACDRVKWASDDKFNLGSGLYDGANQNTWLTDAQKLYGVKANQWWPTPWSSEDNPTYYGFLFGQSIMSFITDPDTRLYIGGKTQRTAEGTLIADMAFFDQVLTAEQASQLFADACKGTIKDAPAAAPTAETALEIGTPVRPEPAFGQEEEEGLLGDVNGDEAIDSKDALAVLKHSLNLDPGENFNAAVANVNGDVDEDENPIIDSKDALEILKYSLHLIDKFSSEE